LFDDAGVVKVIFLNKKTSGKVAVSPMSSMRSSEPPFLPWHAAADMLPLMTLQQFPISTTEDEISTENF
jgi:hypothetical protein